MRIIRTACQLTIILTLILPLRGVVQGGASQQPPAAAAQAIEQGRALINQYCVTCHSDKVKTGGLTLQSVDLANPAAHPEIWEKVIRKLRAAAMPPLNMPRPDRPAYDGLATYLETSLDQAAAANPRPGRKLIHRLNRVEYGNAVHDLLGVDLDVASILPEDSSSYGFDNNADTLTVSPALLEKYLSAADQASFLALGDPEIQPVTYKLPIKFELSQNQRMEGMALGTSGGTSVHYNFPADGEYVLRGKLYEAHNSQDRGEIGEDVPSNFEISIDGKRILLTHFGGKEEEFDAYHAFNVMADEIAKRMTVRTFVTAGEHDVAFTFVDRSIHAMNSQELYRPTLRTNLNASEGGGPAQLETVFISGPYNTAGISDTPSRHKILICHPANKADELPCAQKIISKLASRAYRRAVTDSDVESLQTYYQRGASRGGFEEGIRLAMAAMLTNPSFLFRVEVDPPKVDPNGTYRISDVELASRLSFFLWSSIPDDELLNLATQGKLKNPTVLEQQVKRMIADPRSRRLVDNFLGQWLGLRAVPNVTPGINRFRDFDHQLREAFQTETQMLFDSILHEDRSVFDLLTADYTYVNERLAKHYGMSGIYGEEFRRVPVTDDNRRGLLGQASVLTLTSMPTRTSPVKRGKWILSELLSIPPPPPPPNVPTLPENTSGEAPKSVRERLELHRQNTFCAGCHRNIDPPGFALENFNPIGQWRTTTEDGKPVDASGVLWDGTKVSGPADLRKAILDRSNLFMSTVTERLMTYALGRGVDQFDMPVIRTIDRDAAKNGNRLSSIVIGIIKSAPFQMRSGPGLETTQAANPQAQ
jgi:mono/diheme cytochrome c family protein